MSAAVPTKTEKPAPVLASCLSVRMSAALAKSIAGRAEVEIPIPVEDGVPPPKKGDRILLREWSGAPTGRADLCRVLEVREGSLLVARSWCWRQGKLDDDLSFMSLATVPNHFPKIGFE